MPSNAGSTTRTHAPNGTCGPPGPPPPGDGRSSAGAAAVRIAACYALWSALWIFCSSWVLHHLVHDEARAAFWENVKGWFFVLVTAVLLGVAMRRAFRSQEAAAAQLRESEARLRILSNNLPDSYVFQYVQDARGETRFTHVSAGVETVHGVKPEDVLRNAETLRILVAPEQRKMLATAEAASARNMADFELEVWSERADGHRQLMHLHSRPRHAGDGRILWDGIATDITLRRQAENAAQESSRRYQSLFERMLNGFAHCRMIFEDGKPVDFVYLEVNAAFERLTGLKDVKGKRASEVMPGMRDADPWLLETCGRIAATGEPAQFERHVEALQKWFTVTAYCPAKGEFVAVFEVVTERKLAEAALQRSESRFRALIENAPDGIVLVSPQGKIVFASPTALRMFGLEGVDLASISPNESTHPDDLPRVHALLDEVMRNPSEPKSIEYRFRHRNGEWVWIESIFTNVLDLPGLGGIVINFRNITERRLAEADLRCSEEQFRAMFEMASIGMAQADPETGRLRRVNRRLCQILGYTEDELLKLGVRDITHPDDMERDRELFQKVVRGDLPEYHWEKRYCRKDGSEVWGNVYMAVVRDASGRAIRTVATIEDITERRRLEEQYRQSQKMEAIGLLAGGVAHDFNNILSVIMMQSQLIGIRDGLPPEVGDGLREITTAAQRASALTRQLLVFSRRQVMQPRDLDLNDSVTSIAKMLQRIIGEDVGLRMHLHPAPLMTHADPSMLDQVLLNLAVNARDAMPDGGTLLIETSAVNVEQPAADVEPGPYVCVTVTDTGGGIAKEVLPRIFEPFFTTKEIGKGTGLGLATTFGIVKQHRGCITVASEPGKGATFRVLLPECRAAAPAASATPERPASGNREVILLAEDEAVVRISTRMLLKQCGYTILEAQDGVEALQLWEQNRDRVDLLLTDLVMPNGMTGRQLGRKVRADRPGLPIIYMSGFSPDIAGRDLELQPGEAFLQKPFMANELLRAISASLGSRSSA